MRVSLPDSLAAFVDKQVVSRGFTTRSAYVRHLIRHDRDRQHLRGLLLEGGGSALSIAAGATYFQSLRAGIAPRARIGEDR